MAKQYTTIEQELRDNLFVEPKDRVIKGGKPAINKDTGKFLRAVIVYNKRFQTYPGNQLPDPSFFEQPNTPPKTGGQETGIHRFASLNANAGNMKLIRLRQSSGQIRPPLENHLQTDMITLAFVPTDFDIDGTVDLGPRRVPRGWYYLQTRGGNNSTLEWIANDSKKHETIYRIFNFNKQSQTGMFPDNAPDPVPIIAAEISNIISNSTTDKQITEGAEFQSVDGEEDTENQTSYAGATLIGGAPLTDDDERFLRAFYFDRVIPPELKNPDDEGYDAKESLHDGAEARDRAQNRDHYSNQTLSEQAILLYHLPIIMERNKADRSRGTPYKRFATLDLKDPKNMSVLGNLITSRSDMSALFEDMQPMHLTSMIPRVRVFKPFPDDVTAAEYHFEEYPDEELLKSSMGTSTGTGLMNFEWSYQSNQNFEAATKFVRAKLQLRTQSVDYLVKEMFDGKLPYRFSDMFSPQTTEKELNSSINMGDPIPTTAKNLQTQFLVEYSINPEDKIWEGYSHLKESIQALRIKLTMNNTVFNLSLNDDGSVIVDLDFIGHVDATIADPRNANILSSKESEDFKERKRKLMQQRAEQKAEAVALEDRLKTATKVRDQGVHVGDGVDMAQVEEDLARYDQLAEAVKILNAHARGDLTDEQFEQYLTTKLQKKDLYSRITSRMIWEGRLRGISVDPCDVKSFPKHIPNYNHHFGSNIPSPLYDQSGYKIPYFYYGDLLEIILEDKLGKESKDFDVRAVLGPMTIERSIQPGDNAGTSTMINPTGEVPAIDRFRTVEKCSFGIGGTSTTTTMEESDKIAACNDYLLDTEADLAANPTLYSEYGLIPDSTGPGCDDLTDKDVQGLLSDFELEDAAGLSSFEQKTDCSEQARVFHVVNIADIPISFKLFQRFWAEKIANKNLYSYTLQKFLSDSINSLIVSSLEAESTEELLPVQKKDVVMTTFSSGAPTSGTDAFGFTSDLMVEKKNPQGLLFLEDLKENNRVPLATNNDSRLDPKAKDNHYLIVTVKDSQQIRTYNNTRKEYIRDLEDGIYHLRSGQDAGIIKDIKMNMLNWDQFETYKTLDAMSELKNGPIPRRRVYNCSINLYGAPFFMPCQLVYVNPAAHGSLDNLRQMGLTGYYYVNDVQSKIENGTFMTTLQCTFAYSGEGCTDAKAG